MGKSGFADQINASQLQMGVHRRPNRQRPSCEKSPKS
jgi:hypothetical protein